MDIPINISQRMNSAEGATAIHEGRIVRMPRDARELYEFELGSFVTLKNINDGSPESFQVEAAYDEDVKTDSFSIYVVDAVFKKVSHAQTKNCDIEPVNDITLGCDPELIVIDKRTGNAVSAQAFLGLKKWGPIGYDGLLLEFRPAPSTDDVVVILNMYNLIAQTRTILNKCTEFPELMMAGISSYTGKAAVARNIAANTALVQPTALTAGFHLHYGLPYEILGYQKKFVAQQIVKALDYYVGIPSIIPEGNTDNRRRTAQLEYGKPGMFRIDHRTLEYRTPGAALMKHPVLAQGLLALGAVVIEDVVSRVKNITSNFINLNEIAEDADIRILYPHIPPVMDIFRIICSPTADEAKVHLPGIRYDVENMVGYDRRSIAINNFFDNIEVQFSPDVEVNWRYTYHGER